MAAARTGSSDAFGQAITRLTLSRPAGASRGEPTLVWVVSNDSAPIMPSGVGLVVLRSGTTTSGMFYWLGYRIDDGAASITVTWSRSDAAAWAAAISYRGAHPVVPFVAGAVGGGTGLSWTAPGIGVGPEALLQLLGTYNWTLDSVSLPRGWSSVTVGDDAVVVCGELAAVGGATGDQAITATSAQRSADWLAGLVAVIGAGTVRYYDGAAWVDCPVSVYDGSAWRAAPSVGVL